MNYWITTHSGIKFDLENPKPEMVDLDDIAHALSMMCRFNGHPDRMYSIAEHSLMVAKHVATQDKATRRVALLHDSAEAFCGDVTRPLKCLLRDYKEIETRIWYAISGKFDLALDGYGEKFRQAHEEVKIADKRMLKTEKLHLFAEVASRVAWDPSIESLEPYPLEFPYKSYMPAKMKEEFLMQVRACL